MVLIIWYGGGIIKMAKFTSMSKLFGMLILIVSAVAVAPTIFTELDDLETAAVAPDWVVTLLIIIAGVGLVYLVWRAVE